MAEALKCLSYNPAKLYNLEAGALKEGAAADIVIFSEDEEWVFDKSFSKSSNTPFLGESLPGTIYYTICDGKIVYKR